MVTMVGSMGHGTMRRANIGYLIAMTISNQWTYSCFSCLKKKFKKLPMIMENLILSGCGTILVGARYQVNDCFHRGMRTPPYETIILSLLC